MGPGFRRDDGGKRKIQLIDFATPTPDPSPQGGGEVLLRLEGISKRFPGVEALADVDFDLKAGEAQLLGENG